VRASPGARGVKRAVTALGLPRESQAPSFWGPEALASTPVAPLRSGMARGSLPALGAGGRAAPAGDAKRTPERSPYGLADSMARRLEALKVGGGGPLAGNSRLLLGF
jgi:hypothetical protein